MSIKVYKGLVTPSSTASDSRIQIKAGTPSITNAASVSTAAKSSSPGLGVRVISEAVVTNVRSLRKESKSDDKIREYKEARQVSDEVAEKIRDNELADDAHGETQRYLVS